jgi:hypothetical protein
MQYSTAEAPADEFEFSGHIEHVLAAVAPVAVENFPAAQSMQETDTPTVKDFASLSPNVEQPTLHPLPGLLDTSPDVIVSC